VLDILVASRRDARSAKRFFRKLMKGVAVRVAGARLRQAGQLRRRAPRDPALGGTLILEVSDNRAENSHQPIRYMRLNDSDRQGEPSASCPASAPYHRPSGPAATDSPQLSTGTK
jgi:transposase-like protein